jgi:glycosyltransferase involved in cell wall biosynthesis
MHLYGGAKQVAYLLEGLQRRGVESVVVCPQQSAIAEVAREMGVRVYELPMRGDHDLPLIWRLKRLIQQQCPDLVHLHSRRGADVLGGIAARLAGVRTVVSRRVDNPESPLVVKWKYRLYDRVITISQGIADVLLGEGLPPAKLVCVRSAVQAEVYQKPCDGTWFGETFGFNGDELVMGMVAQLIPRKGHRVMLEAMPGLVERFPNARLIIFGRGPLQSELAQWVSELQLQRQVILAGFRTDLPAVLPCLDLLVHPALMEGLGIALLQAASAGLPIVAANAGGMPEAVEDGVNGRLVTPGSVDELASAIGDLLSDQALRQRMGEAGRQKMLHEFSTETMVEGNLSVYRDLLGE